ncbi:hypothetical protein evm_012306 [Chilo suppressalis]|nr:hypothetical protein evm_012306 [Chilo suppressalis]
MNLYGPDHVEILLAILKLQGSAISSHHRNAGSAYIITTTTTTFYFIPVPSTIPVSHTQHGGAPAATTPPRRKRSPTPGASATPPTAGRRPRLRSPATPQSTASPGRPRFRARCRLAPIPFERAASEFAAVDLRRLELEETRTRLQHERDLRALEVELDRKQSFGHIILIYYYKNVDLARLNIFSKTYKIKNDEASTTLNLQLSNYDACNLPPCKTELEKHLLRTKYIAQVWSNAHTKTPTELNPTDCGWYEDEGRFQFLWFSGNQLPELSNVILDDKSSSTTEEDVEDLPSDVESDFEYDDSESDSD